jgi:hypothetical protein
VAAEAMAMTDSDRERAEEREEAKRIEKERADP